MSVRALDEATGRAEEAHARLADAKEQLEWLRSQNATLQDQIVRIQRREKGLPEVARQPKEPIEPMPAELRTYIEGFASQPYRKQLRDSAFRRRVTNGESWESIMKDVFTEEEETVGQT